MKVTLRELKGMVRGEVRRLLESGGLTPEERERAFHDFIDSDYVRVSTLGSGRSGTRLLDYTDLEYALLKDIPVEDEVLSDEPLLQKLSGTFDPGVDDSVQFVVLSRGRNGETVRTEYEIYWDPKVGMGSDPGDEVYHWGMRKTGRR